MELSLELALEGVAVLPVVIGLVSLIKRFAPDADDRWWLASSALLATGLWIAIGVANGAPTNTLGIITLAILGINAGLAASKLYDETKARFQ